MGGGGGGGGGSAPPAVMKPVPQTELPTGPFGGMGYTPVPQTFTAEGMPAWMGQSPQGQPGAPGGYGPPGGFAQPPGGQAWGQQPNWFAMDSWGKNAATGAPLTQEDLMVQQQQQAAPQQAAPQQAAPRSYGLQQQADTYRRWRSRMANRAFAGREGQYDMDALSYGDMLRDVGGRSGLSRSGLLGPWGGGGSY